MVAQGWRGQFMFSGDRGSSGDGEEVLEWTAVTAAQQCECARCHRAGHPNVLTVGILCYVFYHNTKTVVQTWPQLCVHTRTHTQETRSETRFEQF